MRTSAFAHHVVDLVAAGREAELPRVFDVVEHLLAEGDPDTVELVTMGLIEPLQNIVSHDDVLVGPERVEPLLGPLARGVWDEQAELWTEAARFLHDGPRVGVAEYDNITSPDLRRYYQANKRLMPDGTLISANDIVNYQVMLKNISPVTPAGRPAIPWPAVVVGLVLALALLIALAARG